MATGILSPVHVAFLVVVVLLLFGAKRLPEMGQSLGTGLRGFKQSLDGITDDEKPGAAAQLTTLAAAPVRDSGPYSPETADERAGPGPAA